MFNKEKQSENNIFSLDNTKLNENCQKIVQDAVSELNIVGFMTGYYDENLTITQVSSRILKNLGYTFEEFQKKTSGSLRNLFYGENQTFLEYGRFQHLQGCGEGQMLHCRSAAPEVFWYSRIAPPVDCSHLRQNR